MADSVPTGGPVANSLRQHVLTPVSTAEGLVETERAEIAAERRAYEEFKTRVAGIDTASAPRVPSSPSQPSSRPGAVERRPQWVERIRSAFRETVMGVDHYDEVYGEPLDQHVAAELSAEVAATLQQETDAPFIEPYKRALTAAASDAVDRREAFVDALEAEQESLERGHAVLEEIIETCDGASVPSRHRAEFEDRLDDLAQTRQETVHRRTAPTRADTHDLCAYLYGDCDWTYPVLTAVARFRRVVV